jgi:hypothetical protein
VTLQLSVPSSVPAGNYSPQVIGASGSLSHTLPLALAVISQAEGVLPDTWLNENVGNGYAGTGTSYSNGVFTVQGAGWDIWGESDQFQFAYQTLRGDGSIVARMVTRQNVFGTSKVGVMIREGLTAGSTYAMLALHGPSVERACCSMGRERLRALARASRICWKAWFPAACVGSAWSRRAEFEQFGDPHTVLRCEREPDGYL